jgi:hypothetical protein
LYEASPSTKHIPKRQRTYQSVIDLTKESPPFEPTPIVKDRGPVENPLSQFKRKRKVYIDLSSEEIMPDQFDKARVYNTNEHVDSYLIDSKEDERLKHDKCTDQEWSTHPIELTHRSELNQSDTLNDIDKEGEQQSNHTGKGCQFSHATLCDYFQISKLLPSDLSLNKFTLKLLIENICNGNKKIIYESSIHKRQYFCSITFYSIPQI